MADDVNYWTLRDAVAQYHHLTSDQARIKELEMYLRKIAALTDLFLHTSTPLPQTVANIDHLARQALQVEL